MSFFRQAKYTTGVTNSAGATLPVLGLLRNGIARRTQTNQAVNRSKLIHNWLNLGSQRANFFNDDDSNQDFCHLYGHLFSHCGALKIRYAVSETLREAIKSHVSAPSLMKAIRCGTKDPSQPPTVKAGILGTQTDVNRAIRTQN